MMYGIDLAYTKPMDHDFDAALYDLLGYPSNSTYDFGVRYLQWSGITQTVMKRLLKLGKTHNWMMEQLAYFTIFTETYRIADQEVVYTYHAAWFTTTPQIT